MLVSPEVDNTVERSFRDGTPFAPLQDPEVDLFNSWLVGFAGNDLPHGDVRSLKSVSDMECMGEGYKNWLYWALKHLNTERTNTLQDMLDVIRRAGVAARYIGPAGSAREFDENLMGSALSTSADNYPDVATAIRSIFWPRGHPPLPTASLPRSNLRGDPGCEGREG